MRHVLLLFTTIIMMLQPTRAAVQDVSTLRHGMEYLHSRFDVNFVYDSSLDLDIPYRDRSLQGVGTLEESLAALFTDSGIEFEIMRKYVVLTKAGSKKKPKDYTIFIEEQHDTLNESIVTAIVDPKRNSTQTGLKRIDSSDLNSGFALFSTPDVIKTLQLLPGVSSGTELLSGFYVHGGDGTDNLFLLDGVPIYQMSHLLGLFSSFNTDVIGSMDFYKSGFPARYGSKLSSVVDVTTKDGDFEEFHGTFAVGLIDGRFQLEGPLWKGKTSFNFGLRRTWLETLSIPVLAIVNKGGVDPSVSYKDIYNVRYAFTDLNAKITHKFSNTNVLSANFYTGRDVFRFCNDYEDNDLNGGDYTRYILDMLLSWGNVIGSLNWNYDFNDQVSMRNMVYYSGSLSTISYSDRSVRIPGNDETEGVYMNSDVHNIGVKSDFHHVPSQNHKLRYGGTLQYHIYTPNTTVKTDLIQDNVSSTFVAYSDSLRYDTFEGSLYAEDEIAVTDAFSVNAGLRYSVYATQGKAWHSVEPRLAMKYSFSDYVTAKASYTEMSQPSHLISSLYIDLPTNAWLPSTAKVRPGRSREVAGGLYTELTHNMHLNVEGWYKHMYNLIEYAGAYNFFPPLNGWEDLYKNGQGRSWGAELDFGYDNGRTEANVYYTLSWSQRKFDDFYPDWYRDRYDNRHKLTLMAKHKFGKRFEIYGAWNWHSGNRITMSTHETDGKEIYLEPNNAKLPDYHRFDVGLNFVKTTKRGNTAIWNLSIYNAYCRANAITGELDWKTLGDERFAYYGMAIGVIPIIPTFSYTLKF